MVTPAAHRSDMDFGLLGPLAVSIDGRVVATGGPRQVAVLARLMVTPGQVVSMEQLIDSVWDGGEPSQPHVAIRSYISNLRRAIEPHRRRRAADSILASAPPGYRLAVDPGAVDWVRFQRLIDQARTDLAADRSEVAITELRQALSLWRGEPCAGLPTSDIFEAHRLRLVGLRQTAVELLYESLLRKGEHDAVAAEIEAEIVADPLRERLTELGMLAYYRSGRQSEALALGRRLRERLLDELGIDPSPAIEAVELQILNHDPVLALPPDPSSAPPGPPATTSDVDAGLDAGTAVTAERAGSSSAVGPRHPYLVGRADARRRLWTVAEALDDGRPAAAAVVGEQGIGKTALVRDFADQLAARQVAVLWGHSVADSSGALWPWAQIVLALLESVEDEADRVELTGGLEALAGLGRTVASALPKRTGVQPAPTSEIMLAVTRLLERYGRRRPVVVILEDVHWADRPTITMLEFAAARIEDAPVGLVATWRVNQVDDGGVSTGLRGLSRLDQMVRIDIGPLDHAAVIEFGQRLGQALDPRQAESVLRRAAGNPSFVRELITTTDRQDASLAPGLIDAVLDRVDRVHPLAMPVLRAASLFRAPFTADDLEPLHPPTVRSIDRVLAAAVRSGVLEEVDLRLGTYRFRHGVVSEVLEGATLSSERRTSHRIIGMHLLRSDEAEASYHLAWSPEAGDRALAARIVLDLFHRGSRNVGLSELDRRVRNGLSAAETVRRAGNGAIWDDLVTDALGFLSWRARVEDRPVDWYDNGRRNLRAAVEGLSANGQPTWSPPHSDTPLRGLSPSTGTESALDRLERAVLNLIGWPTVPAGPGDPTEYLARTGPLVGELASAVAMLPPDSPARLAARIHLNALQAGQQAGFVGRARASREAGRLVNAARRRLDGQDLAPVLGTLVARFGDHLDLDELLRLLDEIDASRPGPASTLLRVRHGYPVLVEAGRLDQATEMAEAALSAAEVGGDPLQRTEAHFLWTRHLFWVGDLAGAERSLDDIGAELSALGLPEPLPVLRQRRILRSLRGQPGDLIQAEPSEATDEAARATALGIDRASPAELVFRLAHVGQLDRARDQIGTFTDPARLDGLDNAELALLGAAAHLTGSPSVARRVYQRLAEADDRLIARRDGSVLLGPARIWAGVAAGGASCGLDGDQMVRQGAAVMRDQGGRTNLRDLFASARRP